VKTILEGAKRRLSVPIKNKDPITPDLLSKMYDKMFFDKIEYHMIEYLTIRKLSKIQNKLISRN
jgi:hypothetical protein